MNSLIQLGISDKYALHQVMIKFGMLSGNVQPSTATSLEVK